MIGYKVDQFSKETKVIAYAFGEEKVDAIYSALKNGCLSILITDIKTAQELIDKQEYK